MMNLKLLFFCIGLLFLHNTCSASYWGSEINYEYNKDSNKMYVSVKYWRQCDDYMDNTVNTLTVDAPGCGSFIINLSTTITDITLHKNRYASNACTTPNANNSFSGLEEFVSEGSFPLDTAPFKAFVSNGCCSIYFGAAIGNYRPTAITTLPYSLHYNYAMLNLCNLAATKNKVFKSTEFLVPMHTQNLLVNNTSIIDFGAYGNANDSLHHALLAALDTSKTSYIYPNSPLTVTEPMTPYCPFGSPTPCQPIPDANPAIGFYFDPTTSAITYTPTQSGEIGVAVIESTQWQKDTSGNMKLIGLHRRDFTMQVKPNSNNNTPTFVYYGKNIYLLSGDSFTWRSETRDFDVIFPPSWGKPKPNLDSTFLILKSTNKKAKITYDSAWGRTHGNIKIIFDSTDVQIAPHVNSALVYDNEKKIPSIAMGSQRIYVKNRLNFTFTTTDLGCGLMAFKVIIDSVKWEEFIKAGCSFYLYGYDNYKVIRQVNTDSFTIQLPKSGSYSYQLYDQNNNPFYGFKFANTILDYNQPILKIIASDKYPIYCPQDTIYFTPTIHNNSSNSIAYQWIDTNNLTISADTFLTIAKAVNSNIKLKVVAGACADSFTYFIDSFKAPALKNTTLDFCEQNCNLITLSNYKTSGNFINFSAKTVTDSNQIYIIQNNSAYDACIAFNNLSLKKEKVLLTQYHKVYQCSIVDTVNLYFNRKTNVFSDVESCLNMGLIDLSASASNPILHQSTQYTMQLRDSNNNLVSNLIVKDSALKKYYFNSTLAGVQSYTVLVESMDSICTFKDTFTFKTLSNPKPILKDSLFEVCQENSPFGLRNLIDATSSFNVLKFNNTPFSGSQTDYIKDSMFINANPAKYTLSVHKPNDFGCVNSTAATLIINASPSFSLGNDLNVGDLTNINLAGPPNMIKYEWSDTFFKGRYLSGNAKDLLDSGKNTLWLKITDYKGCQFTDSILFNYYTSARTLNSEITELFPNPTDGILTINCNAQILKIIVYNSLGVMVEEKSNLPKSHNSIDLSTLINGVYLIKIETTRGNQFRKVEILR